MVSRFTAFILRNSGAPWLVAGLLAGAMAAVYGSAFRYPSFNPEHALYYVLNARMGLAGLWDAYVGPGEGFYRPTAFFTYFQAVQALFGPHGIYGFKLGSLLLLGAWGALLYRLALIVWAGDRLAAGLGAGAALVHPIHYVAIYETTGFDLIYQIAVLGCLVLHVGPALAGPRRWPWAAGEVALFVLALTAKEQAVALAPLLVALAVVDRAPGPARAPRLAVAGVMAVLAAFYLRSYLARVGHVDTGAYRTGFDPEQVRINLVTGVLWLCHLFPVRNPVWPLELIQDTRTNFRLGVLIVALLLAYLGSVAWRRDRGEAATLLRCALMLGAFMALPVWSGGRPWHYGLALAAFALIEGRALAWLVRRFARPERRVAAAAVLAVAAVAIAAGNFSRELNRRMPLFRLNAEAIRHPPATLPPGALVLYVTGGDEWPYGAANLFRLVARDPTLDERPLPSLDSAAPGLRRDWLAAPAAFFLVWSDPEWRDCSAALRAVWSGGGGGIAADPVCAAAAEAGR